MAISVPLVLRLAGHVCIGPIDWLLGNGLGGCYVPRVCVCVSVSNDCGITQERVRFGSRCGFLVRGSGARGGAWITSVFTGDSFSS